MSSQLEFTKEIERNTANIYQKIKSVIPALEWPLHAPYIYKINELKKMLQEVYEQNLSLRKTHGDECRSGNSGN